MLDVTNGLDASSLQSIVGINQSAPKQETASFNLPETSPESQTFTEQASSKTVRADSFCLANI